MIHLITGGARSGKSRYAQEQVLAKSNNPIYLATSKVDAHDLEFAGRVNRHRQERDERWQTIEEPFYFSAFDLQGKTVLIDCVTLWLTNFFTKHKADIEACFAEAKSEIEKLAAIEGNFYLVSNEIGMGLHADTEIGRKFTDLQGWTNQLIAQFASSVVFMVSGIPLVIKTSDNDSSFIF